MIKGVDNKSDELEYEILKTDMYKLHYNLEKHHKKQFINLDIVELNIYPA